MAADLENFEYYIKFPSPDSKHKKEDSENGYVFAGNEDKIPVVLLLGWAGCQDKHLAKYSQIYEDRGLITLRYTAPVKLTFWKRSHMTIIGERLVTLLSDLKLENRPIIVHCFSNGGAFLYHNVRLALKKSPNPVQIKGVIFDSAPGKRRILSFYRAISSILGGNPLYNSFLSILIVITLSVVWLYQVGRGYFSSKNTFYQDFFENLKDEKDRAPQLFIYSKNDKLIPFTDVEYFASYRKSLGVDVTSLRYEDSPHVQHYVKHEDGYVNSICVFLNKCLNGTK